MPVSLTKKHNKKHSSASSTGVRDSNSSRGNVTKDKDTHANKDGKKAVVKLLPPLNPEDIESQNSSNNTKTRQPLNKGSVSFRRRLSPEQPALGSPQPSMVFTSNTNNTNTSSLLMTSSSGGIRDDFNPRELFRYVVGRIIAMNRFSQQQLHHLQQGRIARSGSMSGSSPSSRAQSATPSSRGITTSSPIANADRNHKNMSSSSTKVGGAPFGETSGYQRTRQLLHPVRQRHLLGTGPPAAVSAPPSSPHSDQQKATTGASPSKERGHTEKHPPSAESEPICASAGMESPSARSKRQEGSSSRTGALSGDKDVLAVVGYTGDGNEDLELVEALRMDNIVEEEEEEDAEEEEATVVESEVVEAGDVSVEGRSRRKKSCVSPVRRRRPGTVQLPKGTDVSLLPPELAATFNSVSRERLMLLFGPVLQLKAYRAKRRSALKAAERQAMRPTPEALKKLRVFQDFPMDVLASTVIPSLEFVLVEPKQVFLHEREPTTNSGPIFLAQGTCAVVRRVDPTVKRLTPTNSEVLALIHDKGVFNEACFLTAALRHRFVRSVTKCEMWRLPPEVAKSCILQLSTEGQNRLTALSKEKRLASLSFSYPSPPSLLRQLCQPLSGCCDECLNGLAKALKPIPVGTGYCFAKAGEPVNQMIFLRRGNVGVFRTIKGEQMHIQTFLAPCSMLDTQLLHRQTATDTMRALCDCDAFALTHDAFASVFASFPQDKQKVLKESREIHIRHLSMQVLRLRPFVFSIPIVRTVMPQEHIAMLPHLFEAKVYPPLSLVCSKSEVCDRIVILMKGRIEITGQGVWKTGDAVGYTCVIPHRWVHSAVAVDMCECIELRADIFRAFLMDIGLLESVTKIAEALLYPKRRALLEHELQLENEGVVISSALKSQLRKQKQAEIAAGKEHRPVQLLRSGGSTGGGDRESSLGSEQQHLTPPPPPHRNVALSADPSTIIVGQHHYASSRRGTSRFSENQHPLALARSRSMFGSSGSFNLGSQRQMQTMANAGPAKSGAAKDYRWLEGPYHPARIPNDGTVIGTLTIGSAVARVRKHINRLATPPLFPVSDSILRSECERGFAPLGFSTLKDEETMLQDGRFIDYFVPGDNKRFGKHLSRDEKATIVHEALTSFNQDKQRKMTHVTQFLLVKEKV